MPFFKRGGGRSFVLLAAAVEDDCLLSFSCCRLIVCLYDLGNINDPLFCNETMWYGTTIPQHDMACTYSTRTYSVLLSVAKNQRNQIEQQQQTNKTPTPS